MLLVIKIIVITRAVMDVFIIMANEKLDLRSLLRKFYF